MVENDANDQDEQNVDPDEGHTKINAGKKTASAKAAEQVRAKPAVDTPYPPSFPHATLFRDGANEYAADMKSLTRADVGAVANAREATGLFAPCMVVKV